MPIRRMLEGAVFDQPAITLLSEAFDTVVAELGLRTIAERERAARIIFSLVEKQGDIDAAKLRENVVRWMGVQLEP